MVIRRANNGYVREIGALNNSTKRSVLRPVFKEKEKVSRHRRRSNSQQHWLRKANAMLEKWADRLSPALSDSVTLDKTHSIIDFALFFSLNLLQARHERDWMREYCAQCWGVGENTRERGRTQLRRDITQSKSVESRRILHRRTGQLERNKTIPNVKLFPLKTELSSIRPRRVKKKCSTAAELQRPIFPPTSVKNHCNLQKVPQTKSLVNEQNWVGYFWLKL